MKALSKGLMLPSSLGKHRAMADISSSVSS